jgi:hypothetical protein
MKTTVEVDDRLLARARRRARMEGRSLRSLIEEGLHRCLEARDRTEREEYRLPDRSVGDPGDPNPLESMSWAEVRDEVYGGR